MAKATLRTEFKIVKKMVEVEEAQENVTISLNLSTEEAKFLRQIFRRIGGDPFTSARHLSDVIDEALESAGVGVSSHPYRDSPVRDNNIYFA